MVNIFVGGTIKSLGSDAIKSKLTPLDIAWLKRKLKVAEIGSNFDASKMTKIVAGKKLWNYDQLETNREKRELYSLWLKKRIKIIVKLKKEIKAY